MDEEQMNASLDAIYERAESLLGLVQDPEARAVVDEILALSRYKFNVVGDEGRNASKD